MGSQTINGKAFEYALLRGLKEVIKKKTPVEVLENETYSFAMGCFNGFELEEQSKYQSAGMVAAEFLPSLEPKLLNQESALDILELSLAPDKLGILGDVRDVLAIRSRLNWEIGFSAKNNHFAVKHSRLSMKLDFGEKWFGLACSDTYFDRIYPIFEKLYMQKEEKLLWKEVVDKHENVYFPILEAFKDELLKLDRDNPSLVPGNLVKYLIGNKDFYKVIRRRKAVEIQAFNFEGTLNKSSGKIKPDYNIPKTKLPSKIIDVSYKEDSDTTLNVTLDEGWAISFRIHNASSKVEPSLKFDVNLIGHPQSLFTHHLPY